MAAHVMRVRDPAAAGRPAISIAPVSTARYSTGVSSPEAARVAEIGDTVGDGQVLSEDTRRFFEPRFGHDFSRVRIHTDERAARTSREIGARAFTIGGNIAFAPGEFAPHTHAGRTLLAHELTHVVQQNGQPRAVMRAETDTSSGCDDLADTSADINTKVNAALATARKTAGSSGMAVAEELYSLLGANGSIGRTKIELWAETLGSGKVRLPRQGSTKYAGVTYGLWNPIFPILNPTMHVGSVCIGSDKLGHFLQQGMEYVETMLSAPKGKGMAEAEAYGASTEAGKYGLPRTGVFSNADLEANRKGLRFYADLIAEPSLSFDIADYVSARWNEEANPSHYEASVGLIVWSNLLKGTWAGSFTDASTPSGLSTVMVLSVTGDTSLVGGYAYTSSNGTPVTGTIKATIKHQTNALGAVTGVRIEYSWASGSNSGKGFWVSDGESRLNGRWGMDSSDTTGGQWNLSRDRPAEGTAARKKAKKP